MAQNDNGWFIYRDLLFSALGLFKRYFIVIKQNSRLKKFVIIQNSKVYFLKISQIVSWYNYLISSIQISMSYQLMQKSSEQIKIAGGDISFDMQEVFKFHRICNEKL